MLEEVPAVKTPTRWPATLGVETEIYSPARESGNAIGAADL